MTVGDVASIGIEPIPLLASRQGVAASLIKFGEATEADAAGVVFLLVSIGKPPRLAGKRMLRGIFWIAQPPLITEPPNGNLVDASFVIW